MTRYFKSLFKVISVSAVLAVASAKAGDAIDVRLDVKLLVCHEQAGGVRPPDAKGEAAEHDNVFFVVAGRGPGGSEIRDVQPKDGSHLKLDTQRGTKFVKNVSLWRSVLKDGETTTILLLVREQDGSDSAADDLKEAAEITAQVEHAKPLKALARIPVHETLQGAKGENDHIGTVVLRIANVGGKLKVESEAGADTKPLKGIASNDPRRRGFSLNGDHSHYDLHLEVGGD